MKNNFNFINKTWVLILGIWACNAWADLYTISGVSVGAESSSALAAKEQALGEGQVEAFNRLMAKMVESDRLTQVPSVTTESVLPFVLGVSIENEKTTATKYLGKITVQFNKSAVESFLAGQQVAHLTTLPPSLLVIPVYEYGTQQIILNSQNPLYSALVGRKDFAPFYRAVLPNGDGEEAMAIESVVKNGNLSGLSETLKTYNRARAMVLRLKEEGDGTWLIYNEFYPKRAMDNQIVYKKFKVESGDKRAVAGQLSDLVFQEMETKWRQDKTTTQNEKDVLYLRVPVSSLSDWQQIEKQMKEWSFFETVVMRGLYLPQVLVEVSYKDDIDELEQKLRGQGWILNRDLTGNGATLTRGGSNE